MTIERPHPVLTSGMRVIVLARSPEPMGVTSNIGHPHEPVVIGVSLGGPEPIVTISEGSGHLGSGGAFWLDQMLTPRRSLQGRWESVFERANAVWVAKLLGRLAAGKALSEDEVIEAYRRRHGTPPEIRPARPG